MTEQRMLELRLKVWELAQGVLTDAANMRAAMPSFLDDEYEYARAFMLGIAKRIRPGEYRDGSEEEMEHARHDRRRDIKSYAKKREAVRAVRWTGAMSPAMKELLGERPTFIDGHGELGFANVKGPGRFARVDDWIVSSSGEDLTIVGAEQFGEIYEEVDVTGRPMPPTDEEHEANALMFVRGLDALLVDSLRLSREDQPNLFHERDRLLNRLRQLCDDERYIAALRERHRIRNLFAKELTP